VGARQSRKTGVEKAREREQVVPVDRGEREPKPIWPSALYLTGSHDFAIIRKGNANANGLAEAKVKAPKEGWTAFFVELVFDSGATVPYKFTTQVYVVPDTLPHSLDELKAKK